MKKFFTFILLFICALEPIFANSSYWFGMRIQNNDPELAERIENNFGIDIPIITLIYDDFWDAEQKSFKEMIARLGNKKIYHIALNPFKNPLKDLMASKDYLGWEQKYRTFFQIIKDNNLKVIFRPLHEMNGGWYSWGSDPANYRPFWRLIWRWSREESLSKQNILFNFCVNSEDLPKAGEQHSQTGAVIQCTQSLKAKGSDCFTFEDYYPGDAYVDFTGLDLYNWWKGARQENWTSWREPGQIINENDYYALDRLKKLNKPIFFDEAGTTSIYYDGDFSSYKAVNLYNKYHAGGTKSKPASGSPLKNEWLKQLHTLFRSDQIVGGSYFNADVSNGLQSRIEFGELDWTIVDPDKNFIYPELIHILDDYGLTRSPYLYFDFPKEERLWLLLSDKDAQKIQNIVNKFYPFEQGDIILKNLVNSKQVGARYQYFVQKFLDKHDGKLCKTIAAQYSAIECSEKNLAANTQQTISLLSSVLTKNENTNYKQRRAAILLLEEGNTKLDPVYLMNYLDTLETIIWRTFPQENSSSLSIQDQTLLKVSKSLDFLSRYFLGKRW